MDGAAGKRDWQVYIIGCDDGRLYTGITNNVARRWREHSSSPLGAKFFRGRKPQQLLYVETGHDRSSASRREAAIKRLTRIGKQALLSGELNQIATQNWLALEGIAETEI
ncbi:MAG: endonuclease [Verrucomicrobiaceae bacterium]|nr:endonuclease [Verrucomicrobiaceae bacterium]